MENIDVLLAWNVLSSENFHIISEAEINVISKHILILKERLQLQRFKETENLKLNSF